MLVRRTCSVWGLRLASFTICRTTTRVATTPPENPATKKSTSTPMTLMLFIWLILSQDRLGKLRGAFAQARRVRGKNHFADDANGNHSRSHDGEAREPHADDIGHCQLGARRVALDLLHHQERETFI